MPESHMGVVCLGSWGLELPTPNPGSKSTLKACPTHYSAMSPARHIPAPSPPRQALSHRARHSVKIIKIITIKNNNNNNNNNNK